MDGRAPTLHEKGQQFMDSEAVAWGKGELKRLKDVSATFSGKDYKIKTLTFIGGVLMVACGFVGIFSELFKLKLMDVMVEIYIIVFGLTAVVVDAQDSLCPPERRSTIFYYAAFLGTLWGKGIFFLFAGSLMISQWDFFEVFSGLYVGILGGFLLYTGYNANKKLAVLKTKLLDENTLKSKWNEFDTRRAGYIVPGDLVKMCKSLGSELTAAELQAAAEIMDGNHNGRIEFSEFVAWWKGEMVAPEIEENPSSGTASAGAGKKGIASGFKNMFGGKSSKPSNASRSRGGGRGGPV